MTHLNPENDSGSVDKADLRIDSLEPSGMDDLDAIIDSQSAGPCFNLSTEARHPFIIIN